MTDTIQEILGYRFLGNSVLQLCISTGVIVCGAIAISLLRRYFIKRSGKPVEGEIETFAQKLFHLQKYAIPLLFIVIMYASLTGILTFTPQVAKGLHVLFIVTVSIFGLLLITHVIKDSLKAYLSRRDREGDIERIDKSVRGISTFINIIVWSIGAIFIIDNLGFNISAVVTGLGIGGVAIALASQTILHDLFNYFVIFFDQPFKIGDFIVIDNKMGTIEKIGIKTTRIKSLQGEEIVLSNTDLTNSRIHNYKKMEKRRVLMTIGVVYQTAAELIDAIPGVIREIVDKTEGVMFDRAHFKEYGDSGLIFEIVFYILSADYNYFMDKQHEINLEIFKKFSELKIDFAYPTSTLYIEKK
ncbi:MAG: mechanosensitive ion channel family protein [Spirochaetes bacterium]|nr:mechanosensitive ion channel family protein [Spirochaetota bacterium]